MDDTSPCRRATAAASSAFDGFVRQCHDAARTGRPVLVSHSVATANLSMSARLALLPGSMERAFVWSSPWSGQRRLAIGSALDLTAEGPARFDELSAQWQHYSCSLQLSGLGRPPALVGGFSFDPAPRAPALATLLWLPAAELVETIGGPTQLVLNAMVRPHRNVTPSLHATACALWALVGPQSAAPRPRIVGLLETPSDADWMSIVDRAHSELEARRLSRIVLARRVAVAFDRPLSTPVLLADMLGCRPAGAVFGARLNDRWLLGQTSECLLHLRGDRAASHGLAGAPREFTAGHVESALRQSFRHVSVGYADGGPEGRSTSVSASARVDHPDVLQLCGALHPTPATSGHPIGPALRFLRTFEGFDRGWYGAPVGWVERGGDGEFVVAAGAATADGAALTAYTHCRLTADTGSDEPHPVLRALRADVPARQPHSDGVTDPLQMVGR